MVKKLIDKTKNFYFALSLILIIGLSFFALKPFLHTGFFPVHDNTQVQRVFEMGKALGDGMFPVRWVNDLGYGNGYPIFNFYAPLPYYFAGKLVFLGIDALLATKLMFVLGIVASGIFMLMFSRQILGNNGGLLAAAFYLLAPYHAENIFIRGDVGEVWSYAFIPLVFYSLYKIYKTKKLIFSAILGISYALVILSHNLSAFMITPFIITIALVILYQSFKNNNFRSFRLVTIGIILGLLLSAFYFIPALTELKYTNVNSIIKGGSDFRDHFICASQFWSSPWGFGGSNSGCVDGISFKLGKLQIITTFISIALFFFSFKKFKKETRNLYLFTLFGLLVSVFLTLDLSKPVWETISPMKFIQFPWRFLSLINLFSALLIGYCFLLLNKIFPKKQIAISLAITALIIGLLISNAKLFVPQAYNNFSSSNYTNLQDISWTTSKISDEYLPPNFIKPSNQNEIPKTILQENNLRFTDVTNNTKTKEVVAYFPTTKMYLLNVTFFPSWQAQLNYKSVKTNNIGGKIGVSVTKGYQLLTLNFAQTQVQKSSNIFSIIGLIATIVVIILGIKKKNEKIA